MSLVFTAVYHLGYSDFRGDKLRKPLAGDVIWSAPTLITLSPFGAPIAHAGLHVTAVVHSYETDVFLPPHAAGLDAAQLQRVLDEAVSGPDRLSPGATAYVAGPAGSWSGAAGVANVETGEAMTPDARMRLESVSKIWTGTLIHQLAEDGTLRLTDTVATWLPGLLPDGDADHARPAPDAHERTDRQQRRRRRPRPLLRARDRREGESPARSP